MGLTFFGLTLKSAPEVRKVLFRQIHEIVFHGKGGYDWFSVYNMPIWLRKFVFKEIDDYYKEEKSTYENVTKGKNSSTMVNPDGTINTPAFTQASESYKGKSSYK